VAGGSRNVAGDASQTAAGEQAMTRTDELIERVPIVCTFDEANRFLRLSRSTGEKLRRLGCYPVPEMQPAFDDRPRFSGEDILAAIRSRSDFGRSKRWLRQAV
jgi:hypothetical protein